MADDPYQLLGVSSDVSATDLKRAYERRIGEAARLDAFKLAQDIDRAYTLLRDPRRRALFDRHGLDQLPARDHPLARWQPPKAVPFRTWTPAPAAAGPVRRNVATSRTSTVHPCVRAALIGLAITATIAVVPLVSHYLRATTGSGQQVRSTQIRVVCELGPNQAGYSYLTTSGSAVGCSNGAAPLVETVTP